MTCNYELLPMNNNQNMARYFPIPSAPLRVLLLPESISNALFNSPSSTGSIFTPSYILQWTESAAVERIRTESVYSSSCSKSISPLFHSSRLLPTTAPWNVQINFSFRRVTNEPRRNGSAVCSCMCLCPDAFRIRSMRNSRRT